MMRGFTWGPVLAEAAKGDLPLVRVASSAAAVAKEFGGRQPVYLATPYSKEVTDVLGAWSYDLSKSMQRRAERAALELMQAGVSAFSPIALSVGMIHAAGQFHGQTGGGVKFQCSLDPMDSAVWQRWCQPFLNICGAVVVPDIPGWDHSDGIKAEVAFAIGRDIPVFVYGGRT